ncbi:hypothetical protein [Streptomyces goshikiensis]
MSDHAQLTATLIVGQWQSRCGRCRQGTTAYDQRHSRVLSMSHLDRGRPCGARYTAIRSVDMGTDSERLWIMRPDLPQFDRRGALVPEVGIVYVGGALDGQHGRRPTGPDGPAGRLGRFVNPADPTDCRAARIAWGISDEPYLAAEYRRGELVGEVWQYTLISEEVRG